MTYIASALGSTLHTGNMLTRHKVATTKSHMPPLEDGEQSTKYTFTEEKMHPATVDHHLATRKQPENVFYGKK